MTLSSCFVTFCNLKRLIQAISTVSKYKGWQKMSFAKFILVLCMSTVFGARPIKYKSKDVDIDTVLEANKHLNQKPVKHISHNANGIISVSQKPKQVDPEHKSNYITTSYKGTDPEIEAVDQDNQIAHIPSKPVQGNSTNRSTNTIEVLSKKSEQKDAELKTDHKDQKNLGAVTNNLEILTSDGERIARSINDVTIVSEHNNLLSVMIDVINRLMQFRRSNLSEQNWNVVSTLFESFLSVLFGPNIPNWWPIFTRILAAVTYEFTDVIEDTDSHPIYAGLHLQSKVPIKSQESFRKTLLSSDF